jgi:transcriptional repressor NrdR
MRCPFCGDETNKVIDSRLARDGEEIRRRRECLECGQRFTTRERHESFMPRIIKQDARREEYSRAKLLGSIERACTKRPVSAEAIDRLVARVERHLQEQGEGEVASSRVGERILAELVELDPIAAVRFASVFLDFESAGDYADFFASVAGTDADEPAERETES